MDGRSDSGHFGLKNCEIGSLFTLLCLLLFLLLIILIPSLALSCTIFSLGIPGAVGIYFCPERSGLTRSGCAECTGGW